MHMHTHTHTHTERVRCSMLSHLFYSSNHSFQFHESSFDEWKERYQNILAEGEGRHSEEEEEDPMEA